MAQTYQNTALASLQVGESFLPAFERNVAPWRSRIRIHAGDLTETRWDGGPIEFLFIDAMKSWTLANAVVRGFYTSLVERQSVVVHQDFVHWNTPWIPLLSYRFRDWLRPLEWVRDTPSYVFHCVASPPLDELRRDYHFASFSDEESQEAFDFCRGLVPREWQANIHAAQITCAIYRGQLETAQTSLARILSQGWPPHTELRHVAPRLRRVEALGHLVRSPEPLTLREVDRLSFLSVEELELAIHELESLGLVERPEAGRERFIPTVRGRHWIESSFDRHGLGLD